MRRLEFHYTPKHASWLNMVEIEIGVLRGQCLDRRIDDPNWLRREIDAWERQRNAACARINWMCTTEKARAKWAAPIPSQPKSHNHCDEVLVPFVRDHLAVIRQASRQHQLHIAAKLRHGP